MFERPYPNKCRCSSNNILGFNIKSGLLKFAVHNEIANPIFGHVQATWTCTCTFALFPSSGFSSILKKCLASVCTRTSRFSKMHHVTIINQHLTKTRHPHCNVTPGFSNVSTSGSMFEKLSVDRSWWKKDVFSDWSAFLWRDWVTSSDWAEPATLYMSEWARPDARTSERVNSSSSVNRRVRKWGGRHSAGEL